jgi:hypothetical protein
MVIFASGEPTGTRCHPFHPVRAVEPRRRIVAKTTIFFRWLHVAFCPTVAECHTVGSSAAIREAKRRTTPVHERSGEICHDTYQVKFQLI